MLRISADAASPRPKTTAHLLPCRVHFDGPVEPAQSYWSPIQSDDGTKTAYFRGRKLQGQPVKLPEGYRGVVIEKQAPPPAPAKPGQDVADNEHENGQERVPLGSVEAKADFEELVVWGHETKAEAAMDPYLRIGEWARLAEQIHSYAALDKSSQV